MKRIVYIILGSFIAFGAFSSTQDRLNLKRLDREETFIEENNTDYPLNDSIDDSSCVPYYFMSDSAILLVMRDVKNIRKLLNGSAIFPQCDIMKLSCSESEVMSALALLINAQEPIDNFPLERNDSMMAVAHYHNNPLYYLGEGDNLRHLATWINEEHTIEQYETLVNVLGISEQIFQLPPDRIEVLVNGDLHFSDSLESTRLKHWFIANRRENWDKLLPLDSNVNHILKAHPENSYLTAKMYWDSLRTVYDSFKGIWNCDADSVLQRQ